MIMRDLEQLGCSAVLVLPPPTQTPGSWGKLPVAKAVDVRYAADQVAAK